MATITPSTFNPLLAHVNVRLQQGVPIVDADWNLLDDIRKFELRAFLKWFVGDGVPDGNNGFRIGGGPSDDFSILAGGQGPPGSLSNQETALRQVGRYIVDGLDVMIRSNLTYKAQPLHQSQPGSAALAAKLGVPVIAPLTTTPVGHEQILVELDVWERLLTPDEEPGLVHVGLGVETCARTRREWVVRAYNAEDPPPERLPGHSYALLAQIVRHDGQTSIPDGQVIDLRQRRLLVPPANLVTDMLGVDPYEYRAGGGRPPISIREAVNALLAGQLPTTPDLPVSSGTGADTVRRAFVLDSLNGLAAFWISPRVANTNQIVGTRLDLATPEAGFPAAVAVTSGTTHVEPTAVALPGGEFLVAYQNGLLSAAATNVVFKRGTLDQLPGATEQELAATTGTADETPFGVQSGDIVTFFVRRADTNVWSFRRYRHTDSQFVDTAPVALPVSAAAGLQGALHASAAGGMVWFSYVTTAGNTLALGRLNPTAPANSNTAVDHITTVTGTDPFVVGVSASEAMVFHKDTSIKVISAAAGAWGTGSIVTIPSSDTDITPAAVRDTGGTCFLLTTRSVTGSGNEVFLRRRDPVTGVWGAAQQIISSPAADQNPHPVLVPGQGIWVLWRSDRSPTTGFDLYAKRIVTAI